MASLINTKIKDTYEGLIKTLDNLALSGTAKAITDGAGNPTNITMSTTSTNFLSGTVDFTGATVSGLPADTDTTYTLGSVQDGLNADIVLTDQLGNTSKATLVAGTNITLSNLGNDLTIAAADGGLAEGTGTNSLVNSVGGASTASGLNSIAIGNACNTNQEAGIALGDRASATGYGSFAAGLFAQAAGFGGFALGQYAESSGGYGSAFGPSSRSTATSATAFGQSSFASHEGAVAMGRSVETVDTDTTHVRALYVVSPDGAALGGNGITLLSPDGTEGVISLLNGTSLALDGTAIGGGGAAGLENGTGTDSLQSASTLTTVAANAAAADTIALGDGASATSSNNIAIGNTANAGGDDSFARGNIAIGFNTDATNEKGVAIGNETQATGDRTVAIGDGANASGGRGVVVGASSSATAFSSAVFGAFSTATAEGATVVGGYGSSATAQDAIAVGKEADATAVGAIAIGKLAQATGIGSVAIGDGVNASTADTVTVNKLQMLDYATLDFADDTAAATAGIPLGGVYHTTGALKIRIA